MRINKLMLAICGIVGLAGCVSVVSTPVRYPLSDEKPVLTENYPIRTPSAVRGCEKIVGVWEIVQSHETISSNTTTEKPFKFSQIVKIQYKFYKDQTVLCNQKVGGTEHNHRGKWSYDDGKLTLRFKNAHKGLEDSIVMNTLWYSNEEVELRYADLRAYEKMFYVSPNVKSMTAFYNPNGTLETRMYMDYSKLSAASVFNSIYSPMIMSRIGDVSEDD